MKPVSKRTSTSTLSFIIPSISVIALCSALGCGDDDDASLADAGGGDAGIMACDPMTSAGPPSKLVVVGTDFTSPGTLATIDLATRQVQANRAVVGSDPVLRSFGGCVFVINRFSDSNIQVFRASDLALVRQWSTGAGSNPHDIAIVSPSKAYVALFAQGKLLVADPFTGNKLGEVDLSMFDSDMVPDMDSVVVMGGRAYVSLERLDSTFMPSDLGLVAVIDTATDRLVDMDTVQPGMQAITLAKRNPFGLMRRDGDQIWLAEVGDFSGMTGCLERINSTNGTASGCLVTDVGLGGNINGFALEAASSRSWVSVSRSFTLADIVAFSKVAPFNPSPFSSTSGYDILDVVLANDVLYAADSFAALPGVRVFMPSGAEMTTPARPLDIGKPPVGLALAP